MKKFGKLEKIDLHELWQGEAVDFTPWLSENENITELGNAIGMELEVQRDEQKTGVFQAAILCKDITTDHFVLVGNQLERTDNTRLGQLITSAAGLEAGSIVWIAREISEEHIATLNWLNNVTGGSVRFFGVEVEAYRIGDSLPATNFNTVVKPNGWTVEVKRTFPEKKLSQLELLELEYWHGLKNFLESNNSFVRLLGTPPKSWFNVARDKGKYFLTVSVNSRDISLNILLNIIGENAREDFDRLYEIAYNDSLIEVNQDLMWNKMQAKMGCAVTLKNYADFTEKKDWPNQFAWFKENLERFDKYFRPKIKELVS